jgi:hypothetical protein
VEASTGCRVYIRGKGSIKDPEKVMFFPFRIAVSLGVASLIPVKAVKLIKPFLLSYPS